QMPAVVKSPWPNDNGYRSHGRGESGCKCNTTALRGATRIGTGSVGLPVPVPSSSAAAGQELEHPARSRTLAPTDCPDRAELEGFALGSLPGRLFAQVAAHIEECVDCEVALQALDRHADPLLSQLRRLGATEGAEPDRVPEELIAAVQSTRAPCGAA